MKTRFILLSSTLLAALAGPLQAQDIETEFEGKVTFGVNDTLDDNSYLIGEAEFGIEQTWDNDFGWALSYELEGEKFGWGNEVDYDDAVLLEFITPIGALAYGDMNKRGASELFYNDMDGMALDVVRYKDGYPSLRWQGDIGAHFGYAVSSRNVINGDDDEYSIGIGFENNRFEIGLTYDNGSDTQDEAWAATSVYTDTFGPAEAEVTLSYIEVDGENSLGLSVEAEFDVGLTLGASYAFNSDSDDENGYALSLEYEKGPASVEAAYEGGNEIEYEIVIAYEIADLAPDGTTFYTGYLYEEGDADDTGFYAGVGFGIAENTVLGVAYSQTDEAEGLDVQPGWSAMLTVSF
jgi:hypothetical protein